MASGKRKHNDDASEVSSSNKARAKPAAIARVDPTYGQRSAIPLDEENVDDGELLYEEEMDALAYLRSVRREAEGIPNLLVAPKSEDNSEHRNIYENGVGDFRGRYADGTFYAGPDVEEMEAGTVEEQNGQLQYFESILTRFKLLKHRLAQNPPLEVLQRLDEDTPIYLGHLNAPKVKWWRWKMRTVDPVPAQIAAMDKETVLGLLKLLSSGNLLKRGADINFSISRWIWSLLAKLPDPGALNSEEVGIVRELGKKAVLVGIGIREGNKWEEGIQEVEAAYGEEDDTEAYADVEEIVEVEAGASVVDVDDEDISDPTFSYKDSIDTDEPAGNGFNTDGEIVTEVTQSSHDELALAKARMLESLKSKDQAGEVPTIIDLSATSPLNLKLATSETDESSHPIQHASDDIQNKQHNSNATVDMILTIAGDLYGQRDLLEFRGGWTESV